MVTGKKQRPPRLSATYVKNLSEPGRYSDGRGGHGLTLLVKRTKAGRWSKTWSQRLKVKGTFVTRGLGSYPLVSLAMARARALDNAIRVARGEDIRELPCEVPTVTEAFERYIALASPNWRSEQTESSWRKSLEYCQPIDSMLVSDVTSSDVLRVIEPLRNRIKVKVLQVRSHLSGVMRWAMIEGYRVTDPAAPNVTHHLGKRRASDVNHHPSLHHSEVGRALAKVRDDENTLWVVKVLTIFIALTAVRKISALEATWDQIDLEAEVPVWRIPRTKNEEALDVPLSTQAVELLLYIEERTGGSRRLPKGVVFPGRGKGGHIGETTVNVFMGRLGLDASPHGFRSSFRNWAGEKKQDPYASEKALGHVVSSAVEAAYLTTDFFEMRTPIMQQWADYIEKTMGPVLLGKSRN